MENHLSGPRGRKKPLECALYPEWGRGRGSRLELEPDRCFEVLCGIWLLCRSSSDTSPGDKSGFGPDSNDGDHPVRLGCWILRRCRRQKYGDNRKDLAGNPSYFRNGLQFLECQINAAGRLDHSIRRQLESICPLKGISPFWLLRQSIIRRF